MGGLVVKKDVPIIHIGSAHVAKALKIMSTIMLNFNEEGSHESRNSLLRCARHDMYRLIIERVLPCQGLFVEKYFNDGLSSIDIEPIFAFNNAILESLYRCMVQNYKVEPESIEIGIIMFIIHTYMVRNLPNVSYLSISKKVECHRIPTDIIDEFTIDQFRFWIAKKRHKTFQIDQAFKKIYASLRKSDIVTINNLFSFGSESDYDHDLDQFSKYGQGQKIWNDRYLIYPNTSDSFGSFLTKEEEFEINQSSYDEKYFLPSPLRNGDPRSGSPSDQGGRRSKRIPYLNRYDVDKEFKYLNFRQKSSFLHQIV